MKIVPRFRDITSVNPANVIYLKGKENVDGSLRIIKDDDDPLMFEFQVRVNGAWNKTGVEVGGDNALLVSEGLTIAGAGPHIRTKDNSTSREFIHPRTGFDTNGSVESGIAPHLDSEIIRSITQPDESGIMSGSNFMWEEVVLEDRFLSRVYFNIVTQPTDVVEFHIHSGSHNGEVFFEQNIGPSDLPVGEISIDLQGWVNWETKGTTLYYGFTTDSGIFAVKSNLNSTKPWVAYNYYKEHHHHLAPMEYVTDSYIFDEVSNDLLLTTDGNMITTCPTIST